MKQPLHVVTAGVMATAAMMSVLATRSSKSPEERLSEGEFEVFVRLAKGETEQGIAEILKLSSSIVSTHLHNVKQKLGVANQAELLAPESSRREQE